MREYRVYLTTQDTPQGRDHDRSLLRSGPYPFYLLRGSEKVLADSPEAAFDKVEAALREVSTITADRSTGYWSDVYLLWQAAAYFTLPRLERIVVVDHQIPDAGGTLEEKEILLANGTKTTIRRYT